MKINGHGGKKDNFNELKVSLFWRQLYNFREGFSKLEIESKHKNVMIIHF